ncbi:MAG: hypothetical protein ACREQ7_12580 [Candidatus Binatia bacterium]
MNGLVGSAAAITLLLAFSGQVSAGGARVVQRSGQPKVSQPAARVPAAPIVERNRGRHVNPAPGHVYKRYPHHHYPRYYRYYRRPVVVAPNYYYPYYYPYYTPAAVLLSSPFYCFVHHEGFISRVGFLDHISGTHKVPLETAASVCPEGGESCVIEGY